MRLLARSSLFAAALVPFAGAPAMAADHEVTVTPEQQTGLSLTVYQQDLALIQDRRTVALKEGVDRVAFAGVSAQLRPETVLVQGADGSPLHLLEQRFESDLLTPRALLEASVGHEIRIAIRNPQTGEERIEKATILAAAQGLVLKIGDRIETVAPGRLVYESVPAGLRERPTLVLVLDRAKAGTQPIELDYLTGGISWSANYVAELNAAEDKLTLSGRASIANTSGVNYRSARVAIVAGTLNRVGAVPPRPLPRATFAMAAAAPAASPAMPVAEDVADYYRYAFAREIALGDHETIQLAFLDAPPAPVKKEYWLADTPAVTGASTGQPIPLKIEVRLGFDNAKANGLGMPLPSGIVRIYQRDAQGAATFLGEDHLSGTAGERPVKLVLGQAFDVTAERLQTSFSHPSDKSFEAGEQITLHNAGDKPATVIVAETLPGEWNIAEESDKHEKMAAATAQWRIEVPAKGDHKLTYRVVTHF